VSHGQSSIDVSNPVVEGSRPGKWLRELIRSGRSFSGHERNCFFLNVNGDRFANVSALSGLDVDDDGRAIGLTDWDHDGDLDCWLVNRSGPQIRFLRNESFAAGHRFVAFKLEGRQSNRDAIGARVERRLPNDNRRWIVKTVRAGDGYLSQSSKWLHFGLGSFAGKLDARVRWPGGKSQEFIDLETNRAYTLVEGELEPQPLKQSAGVTPTPGADHQLRADNVPARIVLPAPLPLPRLDLPVSERDGASHVASDRQSSGRVLLILWASWCPTCVEELEELRQRTELLSGLGLRVIALNVDQAASGESPDGAIKSDSPRMHRLTDVLPPSIIVADASMATLDRLQLIHNHILDLHEPLPIPCGFLIGPSGKLSAIYMGRIDFDQLASDVRAIELPAETRRDTGLPFRGRWSSAPRPDRLMRIALSLLEVGDVEAALDYLDDQNAIIGEDRERHILFFNVGQEFTRREQHVAAVGYYRRAIEDNPELGAAHFNLGVTLARTGELQEARRCFERVIRIEPSRIDARVALGSTLARLGLVAEAADAFQHALTLDPRHGTAHYERAVALALLGKIDEATEHFIQARQFDADHFALETATRKFLAAIDLGAKSVAADNPASNQVMEIRDKIRALRRRFPVAD
jgi:tetratricopeptide (TPR) repeat protein/thiol-disulfide isomerase/thioredoxin